MLRTDGRFPVHSALFSEKGHIAVAQQRVARAAAVFICANFLQDIGVIRIFRSGVFPFVMSVLSGYPMGAKIVGDLRRDGEISQREAMRLMSFCSTSGPAFMVGAVGAGMLGSGMLGGIIAAAHYAGAFLNGLLYTRLLGRDDTPAGPLSCGMSEAKGLQESFTDAILLSFRSLGIVLAYIVLFMFVTDFLHMCGGFSMIESMQLRVLAKGFFEMTVGCGAAAECVDAAESVKCVMCAAIMSWGGLSVLGQTMSMLSGTGIPAGYLVISKITHSLFAAAAAFLICGAVL